MVLVFVNNYHEIMQKVIFSQPSFTSHDNFYLVLNDRNRMVSFLFSPGTGIVVKQQQLCYVFEFSITGIISRKMNYISRLQVPAPQNAGFPKLKD